MQFGDYLRELRSARRLAVRKFAAMAGITPAELSQIESGIVAPPTVCQHLLPFVRSLGLADDAPESRKLLQLADEWQSDAPDCMRNAGIFVSQLPVPLRRVEEGRLNEEDLVRLARAVEDPSNDGVSGGSRS